MTRYEEVRELVKNDALRIKDIAQQTGYDKGHVSRLRKESRLQKVIADAVAAEREACAALLDAAVENFTSISLQVNDEDGIVMEYANTCSYLAEAIRARSGT
jgi:hypothetical protein